MAEYIEKATLLNRVIIPSICSCVQGPNAERLKKFCIDTVNNVSAADVAPVVHGHWIRQDESFTRFKCSNPECGIENCSGFENYCPNCGAKMGEEMKGDD